MTKSGKNGVIICVNLRGLRDNYMSAELAEIRRQDINKIQGDNSVLFYTYNQNIMGFLQNNFNY